MINKKNTFMLSIAGLLTLLSLQGCTQPQTQLAIAPTNTSVTVQTPVSTNTSIQNSSAIPAATATITQPPPPATSTTYMINTNSLYLSDLSFYNSPVNIEGGLIRDQVFWQSEIWIDGKYYAKGLGMHAPKTGIGTVGYQVPEGYSMFVALAGLARQDKSPGCATVGDAQFRVYVNKELKFESGVMHFGPPILIQIAVQAGNILRLEVDKGEDNYECDHATWADARFEP